ncbi:hypothetical protein ELH68_11235 [Rhizobium ruizarguesonis]|nr:hypothetical protein ELH85_11285 [Rhizobium ruizarguesonis]TAZ78303.1 hypothetical protein ELH68_11235 [Rhizobium ruizarguesonis]TBA04680.1 hypothetical protein ELH64_09795 [Rhizobium ruizarguesonis]TBA42594.1 hypothetical protein ELH62_09630 [Rhizobium ruizarguesonis]TBC35331.1 hypothetical protein ELH33_09600 [Rhizobium ruizarguesonis]
MQTATIAINYLHSSQLGIDVTQLRRRCGFFGFGFGDAARGNAEGSERQLLIVVKSLMAEDRYEIRGATASAALRVFGVALFV